MVYVWQAYGKRMANLPYAYRVYFAKIGIGLIWIVVLDALMLPVQSLLLAPSIFLGQMKTDSRVLSARTVCVVAVEKCYVTD